MSLKLVGPSEKEMVFGDTKLKHGALDGLPGWDNSAVRGEQKVGYWKNNVDVQSKDLAHRLEEGFKMSVKKFVEGKKGILLFGHSTYFKEDKAVYISPHDYGRPVEREVVLQRPGCVKKAFAVKVYPDNKQLKKVNKDLKVLDFETITTKKLENGAPLLVVRSPLTWGIIGLRLLNGGVLKGHKPNSYGKGTLVRGAKFCPVGGINADSIDDSTSAEWNENVLIVEMPSDTVSDEEEYSASSRSSSSKDSNRFEEAAALEAREQYLQLVRGTPGAEVP